MLRRRAHEQVLRETMHAARQAASVASAASAASASGQESAGFASTRRGRRGAGARVRDRVACTMYRHAPPGYDCPFCAIVAGRDAPLPYTQQSDVVLRAGGATAFISSRWWPNNAGHVLVVPDTHVENLYELTAAIAAPVHEAARRVAIAMKQAYGCAGTSTRQHNEPAGDQEVWHYHLHVFPRYEGDRLYELRGRFTSPEERAPYAARLREVL